MAICEYPLYSSFPLSAYISFTISIVSKSRSRMGFYHITQTTFPKDKRSGKDFPYRSFISFSIHVMITSTKYSCWIWLSSLPVCILCHFRIHSRQQVAVACCAINTGWPRIGVCFPSFGITAGASRFAIKSLACCRIVSSPFSRTYSLSFSFRWKLLRNFEFPSRSNSCAYH